MFVDWDRGSERMQLGRYSNGHSRQLDASSSNKKKATLVHWEGDRCPMQVWGPRSLVWKAFELWA